MAHKTSVQATLDGPSRNYGAHIVKAGWDGFVPVWTYYDIEKKELGRFTPVCGEELDILLSPETLCVGDYRKEVYEPCPTGSRVGRTSQCRSCSKTLIEIQECIFEPRCHGSDCAPGSKICREEHAVYLAFYGHHSKVGLTLRARLRTRLIEQGADAYSLVQVLPDRLAARELEREISKKFKIPERIHPSRTLALTVKEIDRERVGEEYLGLREDINKKLGVDAGRLNWLKDYPMKVLRSKPRKRGTPGRHNGTIAGMKGKYLFYENNGINALNMNQMPARFCSFQ